MRRSQRLIAATVLIALSGSLAGCGGGGLSGFDPSDLLDFLDTKKKLPGERKPVFPEGVPGMQTGVPKELYRGASAEPAPEAAPPPVAEPKAKRGTKSRSKDRAASRAPAPVVDPVADPDAAPAEENSAPAAPPAPKGQKITRRRTTAPPPDAAPAPAAAQPSQPASAFPAPLPSGTFSR